MAIYHYSIMILEDLPEDRLLYCQYLSQDQFATYSIVEVETAEAALNHLTQNIPDLILTKHKLIDRNSLEFINQLKTRKLEIPVIMIAEEDDTNIAVTAMKNGVDDYIVKNKITPHRLCGAIHTVVDKSQLLKQLRNQEKQQQILADILLRIRKFFNLQEILQTAVAEIQTLLLADRVILYQCDQQMNCQVRAESVSGNWAKLLNSKTTNHYFQKYQIQNYLAGETKAISDIYCADLTEYQIKFLEENQIQASLTVPILLNQKVINSQKPENQDHLWGLLIAHHCSNTREWKKTEIELLQQLSVHLSVAIQQAEMYENIKNQNIELAKKVETSEQRFQAIFNNTFQFTGLLNTEGILLEANQTALEFGGLQPEDVINKPFWEAHWWKISSNTQEQLKQAITRAAQGEFIRYEVDILGSKYQIATIDFSLRPLKDETGKVIMLIPEGRDITEKNRLAREHEKTLKALQESESELRGLFNAMVDVILVLDENGRYLKIAPTAANKLYKPAPELLGKTVHEIFTPSTAEKFINIIRQTLNTQKTTEVEYQLKINHKRVWFSAKVSPISHKAVIWAARDITESKENAEIYKQAEKALQENQILLQLVMDSLPMAIFWKDKNSKFLGCNRQLLLDAGLSSRAEIIGKTDFDMPWREQAASYQQDDRKVIESGESKFKIEEKLTKINQTTRYIHTNKIPLHNLEGEIIGILGSYEDITERKEIEQALQESERRYATLTTSAPVGIYRIDSKGNCLYVNPKWCEITGLTFLEAIGSGWKKALYPGDREKVETEWNLLVKTGKIFCLEYRFQLVNGVENWVFGQAVAEKDSTGKTIGYIGTITDISSRKKAEQALRQSEQLYRTLVDNFPNGAVVLFDHNLRYVLVGGLELARKGLDKQQMEGKTIWEIFPVETCEVVVPHMRKALAGETIIAEVEYQDRLYITHNIPVRNQHDQVIAGIIMTQDITEQKKSENALRDSEERFRQFAENSQEVILVREVESGKLLYVNPAYTEIWGKSIESLYENPDSWKDAIHPDDIAIINQHYQKISERKFLNTEYRIIRPDGSIRWIWGRCFPIYDANGKIYRIGAIAQDITERKIAEQERDHLLGILSAQNYYLEAQISQRTAELRASEKRFRNLVETSSDWVWEVNEFGIYIYASPQIINILGYTPAEILGRTPFDLMPPAEADRVLAEFTKFASVQVPFQCLENTNRHKDGRLITLETSGVPIFDENNQFRGYRGMDRDVTARKQAEKRLRQNEARFQRIASNVPGVMYQYVLHPDNSYEFVYISDRCREIYELEPEVVLENADNLLSLGHPEDTPLLFSSIAASAASLEKWSWEGRIITPSGKIKWVQCSSQPEKQANGDILWDGLIIDVSERKQIEIAFRNISDRLDLALKSAQIGIWDWDIINDHLVWDHRMYQLYEVNLADFTGTSQTWKAVIHPEDSQTCRIAIQQAIAGEKDFEEEFRIICPNDKIKYIKAYSLIQRDQQGNAQRMIGLNFDISDRKQEELENKRLKERLQFVLSGSPAVIYTCHPSQKFTATFISDNVHHVLGYTAAQWLQETNFWSNHIHPEDLTTILTDLSHLEQKEYHLYQYRFRDQNGNYRWLEDEFRLVKDPTGKPLEIIGYLVDITEQKAALHQREIAEAEIIRSRDLLQAVFNESADAIFLVDIETVRTLDCNQKAVEMFAANSKDDLIDIEGHILQKHPFTPEEIQAIMTEMSVCGMWSREIEYKTFTGEIFWGSIAAKEITIGSQRMNLVRVSDISQRKQVENQLQEKNKQLAAFNEQLARATRLKDEFLANMSHELRTPLNAILGISEGLQDSAFGVINSRQRQGLETIERSGKHLLELINDILDLSKIEAGQIELHYAPTNIQQVCKSSVTFIKQQAFQKNIQLEINSQTNLPEILVDERRIRQVLINLLNNAVKFTPEGGTITLDATFQNSSSKNFVAIKVIDTGIGIATENIHKLFQPFVQIDSALNRQYNGTGLGLSLVKRIVELHGGEVSVDSTIGVGSCFTILLPCHNLCNTKLETVNPSLCDLDSILYPTPKQSPLILLAEDNEANIFTITNYLEVSGYRIIVAKNGKEAIQLTNSQCPDLILMDIQMPEVDGMEAIKTIRQDSHFAHIPIIALTALAMPGDKEKCLAAGATHYLTKPVKLKQLTTIIKKFLAATLDPLHEHE
ncbi:MAG: PAS domain S-box protein [Nostocales cyanobacterium]|nr:MAG: PAS domain S-box protein [Nostocales cyanobacterium]TAF19674.1 MAG: PAS domain S-box protein [Nostocales cyanobacterium]